MPLSPNELTLTAADIIQYHERGYWVSPKLFTDDELAALREAVIRVVSGQRDGDASYWFNPPKLDPARPNLIQVCNGWYVNMAIRRAVLAPVIGYVGAQLMDTPEVRLWHDQVIYKPGLGPERASEKSGNVGWHQDASHWQAANTTNFCTAWVALQDTDLTNGGMRTIVGSNHWGLHPDAYSFGETDLEGLAKKYARPGEPWIDEPCILKAGQASFHHALTFHGSGPNLTRQPRLSFISHLMPKGTGYNKDGLWHANIPFLGPDAKNGDLFEGRWFPRLWPA